MSVAGVGAGRGEGQQPGALLGDRRASIPEQNIPF
jgi:hypothetical protein